MQDRRELLLKMFFRHTKLPLSEADKKVTVDISLLTSPGHTNSWGRKENTRLTILFLLEFHVYFRFLFYWDGILLLFSSKQVIDSNLLYTIVSIIVDSSSPQRCPTKEDSTRVTWSRDLLAARNSLAVLYYNVHQASNNVIYANREVWILYRVVIALL